LGEHPIRSDGEKFLAKYRPADVSVAKTFPQLTLADGPGDAPLTADELEVFQFLRCYITLEVKRLHFHL
jgi:tripeptidyl-peptidase-1